MLVSPSVIVTTKTTVRSSYKHRTMMCVCMCVKSVKLTQNHNIITLVNLAAFLTSEEKKKNIMRIE